MLHYRTTNIRLAMGYGALVLGAVAVISAALYFETVGVLVPGIDTKLLAISGRLTTHFETRGSAALQQEIQQLLTDGIDQDTEVYLLVGPDGGKMVGNLSGWPSSKMPLDRLFSQTLETSLQREHLKSAWACEIFGLSRPTLFHCPWSCGFIVKSAPAFQHCVLVAIFLCRAWIISVERKAGLFGLILALHRNARGR